MSKSIASSPTVPPFGTEGMRCTSPERTNTILPDKYETTLTRFRNLLSQRKEDPNMLLEYDALIKECIKSGILEEVRKPECVEVGRTITYHIMLS